MNDFDQTKNTQNMSNHLLTSILIFLTQGDFNYLLNLHIHIKKFVFILNLSFPLLCEA